MSDNRFWRKTKTLAIPFITHCIVVHIPTIKIFEHTNKWTKKNTIDPIDSCLSLHFCRILPSGWSVKEHILQFGSSVPLENFNDAKVLCLHSNSKKIYSRANRSRNHPNNTGSFVHSSLIFFNHHCSKANLSVKNRFNGWNTDKEWMNYESCADNRRLSLNINTDKGWLIKMETQNGWPDK